MSQSRFFNKPASKDGTGRLKSSTLGSTPVRMECESAHPRSSSARMLRNRV